MINYANEQFVASGYAKALRGMSMVRRVDLLPGQVIYRFYDSIKPMSAPNGPWWVEFDSFQTIKHFAERHGFSFSYAARLFLAILYEWSEVDAFVRCQLTKPVKAWKGRGKQVESTQKDPRDLPRMTPTQSLLEVYQLYLPGFGGCNSLSSSALKILGSGRL